MGRKKGIWWFSGILVLALIAAAAAAAGLWDRPEEEGISRAAACKAAALFLTTADECRRETQSGQSYYPAADQRQWYVKYMDYLYRHGVITTDVIAPKAEEAEQWMTYEEAACLAKGIMMLAAGQEDAKKAEYENISARIDAAAEDGTRFQPCPAAWWWELYDRICGFSGLTENESAGGGGGRGEAAEGSGEEDKDPVVTDEGPGDSDEGPGWTDEGIMGTDEGFGDSDEGPGDSDEGPGEKVLQICGLPDQADGAAPWTAYTDDGVYGFEGLGLSRYLDCRIRVLVKGREIIRVIGLVSEEAVYYNVLITGISKDGLTGFCGDYTREFSADTAEETEDLTGQLADIYLSGHSAVRIAVKRERITAKVLAVCDDAVELEGYGSVPLDEHFRVYKTYGTLECQDPEQIPAGDDDCVFIAAQGKLCAALIVRSPDAESIRVLLMDTGFESLFHEQIQLEFLSDGLCCQGSRKEVFRAGESMVFCAGDEAFAGGRMIFCPSDRDAGIRVTSLRRGQGIPVYPGRLEIASEPEGLVMINELDLEDYLERVLPGEMPLSYEAEALKAQAVCARTYACRQILGNSYPRYGAHVDDSTNFQVYNNGGTGQAADTAVKETCGQMLMYEGEAAQTYYFSTSCGYTTDMGAWGTEAEKTPYLKSVAVRPEDPAAAGAKNMAAAEAEDLAAVRAEDPTAAEAKDPAAAGTGEQDFEEFIRMEGSRSNDYESGFAMYRWQTRITGSQLAEKITDIGAVTQVRISERGSGGAAQCLIVEGTEGMKEYRGESRIRAALGCPDLEFTRNDGSSVSGLKSLPSAFIAVEPDGTDADGDAVFTVFGGGYGHGIGMSQNGAQALAKQGWSYREILNFFYEGTEIGQVY